MLTRRYMHEYGATRDHLANIAIAFRKHAARNPASTMGHKPLTRDDYMNARWISEPLCLFDNCLETDGALAIVITTAERARDLPQPPAYIHAFAQGLPPQHQVMTNFFNDDPLRGPAWTAARRMWEMADMTPADVKVAQLYDAFSPLIILSLEGYGFCERGEGGPFTDNGGIEWGTGKLPVNTAGGGMSEAYVHGFNLILEGARQIRGTSTSQVDNADVSLVTSGEGVPTSSIIFTNQP
jgi:acetyl-CoA acetyltransferase